jgi:tetratricopeptide (TPR) repeat protein
MSAGKPALLALVLMTLLLPGSAAWTGSPETDIRRCEAALAEVRERGDRPEEARLLLCIADGLQSRGDQERALDSYRLALPLLDEGSDPAGAARALGGLGLSLSYLSRFEEALEPLRRAADLAARAGDRASEARWAGYLGGAFLYGDRMEEAVSAFQKAVEAARAAGDHPALGKWASQLGRAHVLAGRADLALAVYEQALTAVDVPLEKARIHGMLGRLYALTGKISDAERHLELALDLLRGQGGDERRHCELAAELGALSVGKGDYEKGTALLEESLVAAVKLQRRERPD